MFEGQETEVFKLLPSFNAPKRFVLMLVRKISAKLNILSKARVVGTCEYAQLNMV